MAQFTLPKSPPKMMPAKKVNTILLKQDADVVGEKIGSKVVPKGKGSGLLDTDKDKK
jgi:hypothetical protein